MKYRKLTGIVLKKQNYKEADQIVTLWTEQAGKVRCAAKSLRSSKSKLSYAVQPLSLVEVELAEKHELPVLVSAKNLRLFGDLRGDLKKTAFGFFAEELMLKMTADEQKNRGAYGLLVEFLTYVDAAKDTNRLGQAQDSFTLKLLASLGYSIEYASGSFKIPKAIEKWLMEVVRGDFNHAAGLQIPEGEVILLHKTVIRFAEYIMERNIKSDTFLTQI